MGIIIAVLSGFALAALAPWVYRLSRGAAGWLLALLPLGLTLYFGTYLFQLGARLAVIVSYPWVPELGINLSFYVDGLSLLFALLISGIGALVVIYAGGYLAGKPQLGRFYAIVLMFMASMLGLVLANNVITLFVFWELTSLASYLLIGLEHERERARAAALQALLVTGGGGLALLAGLVLLAQVGGSLELATLLSNGDAIREHAFYLPILLLILLGAFTKSAQTPFHFWLPNAMEAPTPVSAYLHSATMVKAGVYLLARLSPVLGGTEAWHYLVTAAGMVTMLLGALLALAQTDLKRILAYSTVSTLGALVLLLGLDTTLSVKAAMLFLLVHALYKGALFLVAGAVDHEAGTRDVRQLGGLARAMPITATAAVLAALSMACLPPMLGFIHKELRYEAKLQAPRAAGLVTAAGVAANVLLVAVAGIVGLRPFFARRRETPKKPHEAPLAMWLGPAVLAGLGLLNGLFPDAIPSALVSAAASATRAQVTEIELALWHGISPVFALSVLTVAAGVAIYAGHSLLLRGDGIRPEDGHPGAVEDSVPGQAPASGPVGRRSLEPKALSGLRWFVRGRVLASRFAGWIIAALRRLGRWGPGAVYELALRGLNGVARAQTALLQSGYLRFYLITIIATTVGLVGYALARGASLAWPAGPTAEIRFYEALIGLLILAATLLSVLSSSRLTVVAALGAVGYGVALIYTFFGAPDLAMTQFAIETLTVFLFVLVLYRLPRFAYLSSRAARLRDAVIALAAGGLMTALVLAVTSLPMQSRLSPFFAENAVPLARGRNIDNVILVDFRGLDTLGEITVLAVAAIGVYALLKLRLEKEK
ncbi:MAG: proton-conducting transporter membrane subunit [Anaerolineae bacterium]|nr:proton-conducting transporter membrane subunit [Anaerolineae bacterium]